MMNNKTNELDDERLDWITSKTNRSKAQTQFLYQLVDNDFELLKKLETKIMNNFYSACPGDKDEVEKVLNLKDKSNHFKL